MTETIVVWKWTGETGWRAVGAYQGGDTAAEFDEAIYCALPRGEKPKPLEEE